MLFSSPSSKSLFAPHQQAALQGHGTPSTLDSYNTTSHLAYIPWGATSLQCTGELADMRVHEDFCFVVQCWDFFCAITVRPGYYFYRGTPCYILVYWPISLNCKIPLPNIVCIMLYGLSAHCFQMHKGNFPPVDINCASHLSHLFLMVRTTWPTKTTCLIWDLSCLSCCLCLWIDPWQLSLCRCCEWK